MQVEPFRIDIPGPLLDDLRARLHATRWPSQPDGIGWDHGADTDALRQIAAYWADSYDWRAEEARMNRWQHVRVKVEGFGVHAVHRPPPGGGPAIPLLVMHGWPSSFLQMLPLLQALPEAEARHGVAFDVVAASLPGYGLSDIPSAPGMNMKRSGELMVSLMTALGHDRFAIRASDVGAGIARQICLNAPARVLGLHLSGTNPFLPPQLPADLDAEEQAFVATARAWVQSDGGYAHIHTTRPQTLAHALTDSPAGLAAWILEKFRDWGDTRGDLVGRFGMDALLTNLTLYWATGTIGSSMRLYLESVRDPGAIGRVGVPTGVLMGPADMFPTPRRWLDRVYDITSWTDADAGGHFMEWEEPAAVAEDLCDFVRRRI